MSKENHGSITPRTIRHKEFFPTTEKLKDEISNYDLEFQDQYASRKQQHIEILGRQAYNSELLERLDKYSDSGRLKTKFDKKANIVKKTPEIIGTIGPEQIVQPLHYITIFQHRESDDVPFDPMKPTVRHYGINASNGSIFIGHIIEENQLHPLESIVFNRALSYLEEQIDTKRFLEARDFEGMQTDREQVTTTEGKVEEPEERLETSKLIPKPNNAVLVSFFPRKGNTSDEFLFPDRKTICADAKHTDEVETHTIVLWKTGLKKITIIDPSDKKFSVFLEDVLKYKDLDFEIPALTDVKGKIYQPNKYSKKTQQEFARDCTDIAAKIAFELNEKQVMQGIGDVDVVLERAIEQISNDKLPKEIGLLKPLQSSDVETRIATKELVALATTKTDEFSKKLRVGKPNLSDKETKEIEGCSFLKSLDVTKIITLEDVQEVSGLLGSFDLEDITV